MAAIAHALARVAGRSAPAGPAPIVAVGVGAFLAREAASQCGLKLLDGVAPLAGAGGEVAACVALSVLGRD